eukprot:TRINITY_DN61760_c0_g1_i1.p3 TRINITY_DN61760_c0_g1~~TRINITY_DN61760_c0_g1_i1.p3  ORF type:complete len:123 (+),score=30.46 TRINITY_DN61760_c0_g1_i1:53-370(+)
MGNNTRNPLVGGQIGKQQRTGAPISEIVVNADGTTMRSQYTRKSPATGMSLSGMKKTTTKPARKAPPPQTQIAAPPTLEEEEWDQEVADACEEDEDSDSKWDSNW